MRSEVVSPWCPTFRARKEQVCVWQEVDRELAFSPEVLGVCFLGTQSFRELAYFAQGDVARKSRGQDLRLSLFEGIVI